MPVEEIPFVILDLETTGLRPGHDEILAIGAIRMCGARILVGQTFYRLVAPRRARWDATVSVHRLRPQDVQHAPPASDVLAAFWRFCQGHVLVGYRVTLDREFLRRASGEDNARANRHLWLDIHRLAAWMERRRSRWPWSRQTITMTTLAQRYRLPVLQRHHALADAFLAAQIFQRQILAARAHGVERFEHLHQIAGV